MDSIYKLTACPVKQNEDRSKKFTRLSHPFKIYINERSHIDIVTMDQKAKDAFANLCFQFQDLESLSSALPGTVTGNKIFAPIFPKTNYLYCPFNPRCLRIDMRFIS